MSLTQKRVTTVRFTTRFSDFAALAALYREAGLGERDAALTQVAFAASEFKVFALVQGQVVGAGRAVGPGLEAAMICDLAVLPHWQGRRIGSTLLLWLKQRLARHQRILLYPEPGRESFYHRHGFRPSGHAMVAQGAEAPP